MLSSEGETEVEIETDAVQLLGPQSIWGRSIVLEGPGKSTLFNLILVNDSNDILIIRQIPSVRDHRAGGQVAAADGGGAVRGADRRLHLVHVALEGRRRRDQDLHEPLPQPPARQEQRPPLAALHHRFASRTF